MKNVKTPLILGEGAVFALYFMVAFIAAIKADSFDRKKKKTVPEKDGDNDEDQEKE